MTTIVIADACKPSVVMTSEVFKDKIPGIVVFIADTAKDAIDHVNEKNPDLVVVDFDLPDADGPALVETLRRTYDGPILMTAYPDDNVEKAVLDHLFTHSDASEWIPKPVSVERLNQAIDHFILRGRRIKRRFESEIHTQLIAKASGRGKRAPKVGGIVTNISIGGACVELEGVLKLKKMQELTVSLSFPAEAKAEKTGATKSAKTNKSAKKTKTAKAAKAPSASPITTNDAKIKATVAWVAQGRVGLSFGRLSDVQKKCLLDYLRHSESRSDEM